MIRALLSLTVLSALLSAQTPITILSGDNIGFAGTSAGKNVVRDSNGFIYMIYMNEAVVGTRTLKLAASYDGGATWVEIITSGINDANSGETGSPLVSHASIAIDDQDIIHVEWHRGASGYYNQYYCRIDPYLFSVTPYVDIKAMVGVSTSTSTDACNIVVDPNGTVWMLAGTTSSWRSQLLKSDVPYATTNAFSSVGNVSATASSQFTRLAVDVAGLIHCAYYENTGSGDFRHRAFDPVAGTWQPAQDLGNLAPTNDYTGGIACDWLGDTHLICNRDASGTGNPSLVYYKIDALGTMTGPITIMSATNAQWTGNNQHTVDLACDEFTGDVYVVFRDFSTGGDLVVHSLAAGGSSFALFSQLTAPNAGLHFYYSPRIRGSLYPATNNTVTLLDITWREMWPAPYEYKYVSLGGGSPPSAAYPGNGTDAAIQVSVNGSASISATNQHSVNGGDVIGLTYHSPLGTLSGTPFLALAQPFPTGFPATPLSLPGDAGATVYIDLAGPIIALADGLTSPGALLSPLLINYSISGAIPPSFSGTNTSLMLLLLASDPGLNSVNLGNAEAHELIIN